MKKEEKMLKNEQINQLTKTLRETKTKTIHEESIRLSNTLFSQVRLCLFFCIIYFYICLYNGS